METEISKNEPRVQIQRYSDVHHERTKISSVNVKPSPEALGLWLPLSIAQFQVARGLATFVRDMHGKIHDQDGNVVEGL